MWKRFLRMCRSMPGNVGRRRSWTLDGQLLYLRSRSKSLMYWNHNVTHYRRNQYISPTLHSWCNHSVTHAHTHKTQPSVLQIIYVLKPQCHTVPLHRVTTLTDQKNPGLFQDFRRRPWKIMFKDLFGARGRLNIKQNTRMQCLWNAKGGSKIHQHSTLYLSKQ